MRRLGLVLALALLAGRAWAAIAVDAAGTDVAGAGVATLTLPAFRTGFGTNRILLVWTLTASSAGAYDTTTSVTWNGTGVRTRGVGAVLTMPATSTTSNCGTSSM